MPSSSRTMDVVIACCALVITGLVVRREFFQPSTPAPFSAGQSLTTSTLPDWRTALEGGTRTPADSGAVVLTVLSDFECPACRAFMLGPLTATRQAFGKRVQISYHHWPLPQHRFAPLSARAADCAELQSKFWEMHDVLFERQDSLGLLPFTELASRAGISDTGAFAICLNQVGPSTHSGTRIATLVSATGTPTVILDSLVLSSVPNQTTLDSLIEKILLSRKAADR